MHQVLRLLSEGENEEDLVAEPGPPYFGKGCLSCRKSPDLLKVALVCRHWYYATLPLIYAHCRFRQLPLWNVMQNSDILYRYIVADPYSLQPSDILA